MSPMTVPDLRRVLIVEDVDAMRMLLALALKSDGVELEEAASLLQARQLLRGGFSPDLVILDLELTDGCGLDLVRELPTTASVHVLTADTSSEMRLRCEESGCASIVDKQADVTGIVSGLLASDPRPLSEGSRHFDALADRRYAEFLAECRVKLQACEVREEQQALHVVAHRLRGTAVHFGYAGLSCSAGELSAALEQGDPTATAEAAALLGARIGEALESFGLKSQTLSKEEMVA